MALPKRPANVPLDLRPGRIGVSEDDGNVLRAADAVWDVPFEAVEAAA